MGMPSSKHEVLERESRAWKMRMLGHSEESIGQALGISQQAVSKILARVYNRKQSELETIVAQQKVVVLSRLEWASVEAAEAWERSKENSEVHKVNVKKLGKMPVTADNDVDDDIDPEDVPGGLYIDRETGEEVEPEEQARRLREAGRRDMEESEDDDDIPLTIVEERSTHESRGQTGNPAHLANVLKATQDVRDLLGLDAPKDAGAGTTVVVKVYEGRNVEAEV